MGVSGGSVSNMILTLYGKSDAQRGRDLGRARRADHDRRAPSAIMLAGLPQQALMPPLSIGFVSLIGFALMAPVSSFTATYGARLAHALSRRKLEIAFGVLPAAGVGAVRRQLLLNARMIPKSGNRFSERGLAPDQLRIAAHEQLVAAHLPAFQPVEEAHAEQVVLS